MTARAAERRPVVAIVAASGYAPDVAGMERGIARLEAFGFEVRNFYDPAHKYQRFGGEDAARIAQLHAAAADPAVHMVLALRGGYGLSRLLPEIDLAALAGSGKLFVGHSDFTALQMALLAQEGAVSFAGPMLCDDFSCEEPSEYAMVQFRQCLRGPKHAVAFATGDEQSIDVEGTLWGGNLAMLAHLVGTPYFPSIEGGILFVEDVNEHPYRVERMLLQLLHAGVLARQSAILLGDFSSYRLSDYDNGYDFNGMLAFLRSNIPVPILEGLPFGHTPNKATLAVGAEAELRSGADGFELSMRGYPVLAPRDGGQISRQ